MAKIAFIVTEDWFFASHFLPMAREAVALGFEVVVMTRVCRHAEAIEATGAKVIALDLHRRSLNPLAALVVIRRLIHILKTERPSLVHCISLKPIMLGGMAAAALGIKKRIFAITGWGYLGVRQNIISKTVRAVVRLLIMRLIRSAETMFLFENDDDPTVLGLDAHDDAVEIVGGAGIDPDDYPIQPPLEVKPLRIAVVARMLWSKGVDTAVEAVQRARANGVDVELSLFGNPDLANPKAINEAKLREWSMEPGITWRGATSDILSVWREHHIACLPSRGGEGLPRTLLESAACGRLSLTTNVPGCRGFVRHGIDGYVLPVADSVALATAIAELAERPEQIGLMGLSAAERVRDGYTTAKVASAVGRLYLTMVQPDWRSKPGK